MDDMETIPAIFAGAVIRQGFGKIHFTEQSCLVLILRAFEKRDSYTFLKGVVVRFPHVTGLLVSLFHGRKISHGWLSRSSCNRSGGSPPPHVILSSID
jgi:hypothetical protein